MSWGIGCRGSYPGDEDAVGIVGEVVTRECIDAATVVGKVRRRDRDELTVPHVRGAFPCPREQVGGRGGIGEGRGDQEERVVAASNRFEDAGRSGRIAGDEPVDELVRGGQGHALSVGRASGAALTRG